MMTQRAADSATDGSWSKQCKHRNTYPPWHDASMFMHTFPCYKLMLYQAVLESGSGAMEKLICLIHALSFLSIINVDILLPSGISALCSAEIEEN